VTVGEARNGDTEIEGFVAMGEQTHRRDAHDGAAAFRVVGRVFAERCAGSERLEAGATWGAIEPEAALLDEPSVGPRGFAVRERWASVEAGS
jgi:hypothetical protein